MESHFAVEIRPLGLAVFGRVSSHSSQVTLGLASDECELSLLSKEAERAAVLSEACVLPGSRIRVFNVSFAYLMHAAGKCVGGRAWSFYKVPTIDSQRTGCIR